MLKGDGKKEEVNFFYMAFLCASDEVLKARSKCVKRQGSRWSAGPTCVPLVVTCGPRQGAFKGVIQVDEGPGQHHDVVDVQIGHDDLGCHAHPCRMGGGVKSVWMTFSE